MVFRHASLETGGIIHVMSYSQEGNFDRV